MQSFRKYLPAVCVAVLYVLTGTLSFALLHGYNVVTIGVFIPEGVALAFALYFGKRVLPGIFVGQLVLALLNIAPFPALLIALVNTAEALIAIKLFERFHLHRDLRSVRDITGLALLIVFMLQPFSALLSNAVLIMTDTIEIQRFWYSVFSWWFGNVMGQLLYTPFLLLLSNYRKINFREYLLYGFVVAVGTYIFEIVIAIENVLLFLSITVPFTILIVARRGMPYGTFTTVVGALVSAYAVYLGTGPFRSLRLPTIPSTKTSSFSSTFSWSLPQAFFSSGERRRKRGWRSVSERRCAKTGNSSFSCCTRTDWRRWGSSSP